MSIIIPAYNRQSGLNKLLSDLINSIDDNGLQEAVEVLVIDDYSPRALTIPTTNLNVVLIHNASNKGAPYSRQKGFFHSKGQFVHFHDSDDTVSKGWLEKIAQQLKLKPETDILVSARIDCEKNGKEVYRVQKYCNEYQNKSIKIGSRLIYRNCLGPLGGVTFSRRVLEHINFKNIASCQDWQMYIDTIKHSKVLVSRPDIRFVFNKTGDDRISHNPRKKILGHLQLAKITSQQSVFKRNIRLFYLYTCKQHIYNKGGLILKFYKRNRVKVIVTFLIVSVYWRLT